MRLPAPITLRRISVLVPPHEIEIFLLNGWKLLDEPHCSGARMLPPEDGRTQGRPK